MKPKKQRSRKHGASKAKKARRLQNAEAGVHELFLMSLVAEEMEAEMSC